MFVWHEYMKLNIFIIIVLLYPYVYTTIQKSEVSNFVCLIIYFILFNFSWQILLFLFGKDILNCKDI